MRLLIEVYVTFILLPLKMDFSTLNIFIRKKSIEIALCSPSNLFFFNNIECPQPKSIPDHTSLNQCDYIYTKPF